MTCKVCRGMQTLSLVYVLPLFFLLIASWYWYLVAVNKYYRLHFVHSGKEFSINTPGCKIPKLDLLHPSVKHLFKRLPDLNCEGPSFLVLKENNTIRIRKPEVYDGMSCIMQTISRETEYHIELGPPIRIENRSLPITSEFVKINCTNEKDPTSHSDFYPFIFHKDAVEKRIMHYKQQNNFSYKTEQFRIIMLGIDSVSRNQFLRHMPKTLAFIEQNLVYADLHGYNKVGKDTFSNMVPLLSGRLEHEVPNMHFYPADAIPFIWNEYKQNGYRTLYGEDFPSGSMFNYGKVGFENEPVDYYLRPWSLAVEPSVGKWKTGCLNNRVEANVLFKYLEDFFEVFPNDPLFALIYVTRLTHNDINQLRYHDEPVHDLLERLYVKGNFNNTVMFLFGDHGYRYGEMRMSYIGRMEGRLPLMLTILPPWFPQKYPQMYKNLKENERRLTTPLDIHATLRDLLHFNVEAIEEEKTGRSLSLFKQEVPQNRTCEDAFIKSQWCGCLNSDPVPVDDKILGYASEIVKIINFHTEKYRSKCAELSLSSIVGAHKQDVMLGESSPHDGFSNYLVTIQVFPGYGIFEGNIWFNGKRSHSIDNAIERINLYKNQSACVVEHFLKPYCFCTV